MHTFREMTEEESLVYSAAADHQLVKNKSWKQRVQYAPLQELSPQICVIPSRNNKHHLVHLLFGGTHMCTGVSRVSDQDLSSIEDHVLNNLWKAHLDKVWKKSKAAYYENYQEKWWQDLADFERTDLTTEFKEKHKEGFRKAFPLSGSGWKVWTYEVYRFFCKQVEEQYGEFRKNKMVEILHNRGWRIALANAVRNFPLTVTELPE